MKNILKKLLSALIIMSVVMSNLVFVNAASSYTFSGKLGNEVIETNGQYTFGTPVAIAKDSNNFYYVADLANNRIVKLNYSMEFVTTIDNINMPLFVYVDNQDNILVSELGTNKIKKYDNDLNFVIEWGGEGTVDGKFNIPRSIVQDSSGNYYVSDELNHRMQKFDINGNHIATYGQYGSENGNFKVHQGLSIDSEDRLYVADTYNDRIQVFQTTPTWEFLTSFGTYGVYNPLDTTSYQANIFNKPRGVFVEKSSGKVAVADSSNNRVMVYNNYESGFSFNQSQNGYLAMTLPPHAILENNHVIAIDSHNRIMKFNSTINNTGNYNIYGKYRTGEGVYANPQNVTVNNKNGYVYVTDSFNHRIQVFDQNNNYVTTYGGQGGPSGGGSILGKFSYPKQVDFDIDGNMYVADYANSRIVGKYYGTENFVQHVSSSLLMNPWGILVTDDKTIYVTDWGDSKVKVFKNGMLINSFGGLGSASGKFNLPSNIEQGIYKGEDALFIADTKNSRIQIFDLAGNYIDVLGQPAGDPLDNYFVNKSNGEMLLPYAMTIDSDNNIIVSDTSHKMMRVYNSDGVLLENFGHMSSENGDFFSPFGLDYSELTGKLYISDGVLQRVQIFE